MFTAEWQTNAMRMSTDVSTASALAQWLIERRLTVTGTRPDQFGWVAARMSTHRLDGSTGSERVKVRILDADGNPDTELTLNLKMITGG